ncbi:MAG: HAD-IA family hydrolase [Legionellaceae bacterium]|nr:HAD-IA family hydrolase [Legionellaceae bacterium]
MKRQYDLIVFDWEGTLAEDTLGHAVSVLAAEAKSFHFGNIDRSLARQYLTLGLMSAIKKLFPHLLMYQYEQFVAAVQETLAKSSLSVCLVDDAQATIQQIHHDGFKLAIATNKGNSALQRALQTSGLDAYFNVTRSASQVPAKPCPQMLEEIMDESGSTAEETLMVGDSIADIEMAVSIGVDAIGMDLYHAQRAELLAAGAVQVFDHYQQLADYLNLSGENAS